MGRTIVQEYGPIYGEPVNGTVLGRPNGSVFVPDTNVISLVVDNPDYLFFKYGTSTPPLFAYQCDEDGVTVTNLDNYMRIVAKAQDLSSAIVIYVYSDAELTTVIASRPFTAGEFNQDNRVLYAVAEGLTDGQTVYVVAKLMNNGTPIAVSDVLQFSWVVI